jgi:hypothetical protein
VLLLLEHGADCTAKDNSGLTAMHFAAHENHEAIITLLSEHGADIDAKDGQGKTPLHHAPVNGSASAVKLLLLHGAAVNAVDNDGLTPLHGFVDAAGEEFSCDMQHLECALLLLQSGATILAQTDGDSWVALMRLAFALRYRDLVFTLMWRGVHAGGLMMSDSDDEDDESDSDDEDDESAAADKLAIETMLAAWAGGGLRAWRLDSHASFPAAFRINVQALLLATLGSLDAAATVAQDHAGDAGAVRRSARVARRTAVLLPNPLRTLHERRLLEPIFQALLHAHMGGPPAPPRATP